MAKVTVQHQEACRPCRREIGFMRKLDRRRASHFVEMVGALPPCSPINRKGLLARYHVSQDRSLLSGGETLPAIWRALPLLRRFGFAARDPVIPSCLGAGYRVFWKGRPSVQVFISRVETA